MPALRRSLASFICSSAIASCSIDHRTPSTITATNEPDCTKTLTCEDDDLPTLQPDCVWRYENGTEWSGGPQLDETTQKWRWPDGKQTDTQNFICALTDAGGDAGLTGPDCRRGTSCDAPLVCNFSTGACVECLDDTQCSGNVAVGDAGAATVCDEARHRCVPCLRNADCTQTGNTLVCKINATDSTRNECVQCQTDGDCSSNTPATPVCDETSNACTTTCTSSEQCGGDKPVCNTDKQVCVECLTTVSCTGSDTQCNSTTNECVECIDDGPCSLAQEYCDVSRNLGVQCRTDVECADNTNGNIYCDTGPSLCVQCLDDLQCSTAETSRCNLANNACVGCTADTQCENGLRCNTLIAGGKCVECLGEPDCANNPDPLEHACETAAGRCVECLNTTACPRFDTAHCQTTPSTDPLKPQYACVGCVDNTDCGGKPIPGLCNTATGDCVECVEQANCADDPTKSRCQNGACSVCSLDSDCSAIAGRGACNPNAGCVECVNANHCTGNPAGAVCKTSDTVRRQVLPRSTPACSAKGTRTARAQAPPSAATTAASRARSTRAQPPTGSTAPARTFAAGQPFWEFVTRGLACSARGSGGRRVA